MMASKEFLNINLVKGDLIKVLLDETIIFGTVLDTSGPEHYVIVKELNKHLYLDGRKIWKATPKLKNFEYDDYISVFSLTKGTELILRTNVVKKLDKLNK